MTGLETFLYNVICVLTWGWAYFIKLIIKKAIIDSKTKK